MATWPFGAASDENRVWVEEMSGLPFSLVFPCIDLDGRILKEFLLLFEAVGLLQPVFAVAEPLTEEGQKRGWVRIHRPIVADLDAREAKRLLREFARLGELYQDSGYLTYLKHGGFQRLDEEPGYELVREIREYGRNEGRRDALQETVRGQILLQMAQDLDRQRREIQEALDEIRSRERSLQRSLGLEREQGAVAGRPEEAVFPLDEDDFLLPQRLRAWGELLEALDPDPPLVLLTDNPEAVGCLLERAAETGVHDPLELFRAPVPVFAPSDLRQVEAIRRALHALLPWRIFCKRISALLQETGTRPWCEISRRDAEAAGRALSSYFTEHVHDAVLDAVAAMEIPCLEGWKQAALTLWAFPGTAGPGLPGRNKLGPDPDSALSTLVFFLGDGDRRQAREMFPVMV